MIKRFTFWVTGLFMIFSSVTAVSATVDQDNDVTYYAVVKNLVHRQDTQGNVSVKGYSFLAYIFVKQDSTVSDAYLTFPGRVTSPQKFPDFRGLANIEKDTYFFIKSDKIYRDKAEYDNRYPDGNYTVEFNTSTGKHRGSVVLQGERYPKPAVITLFQEGKQVHPYAIDPHQDLKVTWGGFPQGREDPNGILDDLVFVILKDCHAAKVLHSGRPYQGFHLTYADKDYVIAADTMVNGKEYEIIVDNAILVDTNTSAGLPGIGTYAQTNKLAIRTIGNADDDNCRY